MLTDHSLTFAAAGVQEFQSVGRFIRVRESSSPVYISIDGSSEIEREQGEQVNTGRDNVRVRVRSLVAQTVKLTSARESQDDNRGNVTGLVSATIENGNDNQHLPRVTIAAGASALLSASNVNRKALRVSLSSDAIGFVTLGKSGVAAASGGLLEPGSTDYIETTGEMYAFNNNASAVDVYVMEINKL